MKNRMRGGVARSGCALSRHRIRLPCSCGAVWGNILAGGLIGCGVDASTGAQYNLNPNTISVVLEKVQPGQDVGTAGGADSEAIAKLNELDAMRDANQISKDEYESGRLAILKKYFPEMVSENSGNTSPLDQTGQASESKLEASSATTDVAEAKDAADGGDAGAEIVPSTPGPAGSSE